VQDFQWHKDTLEEWDAVEDELHTGRPVTETTNKNMQRVWDLIKSDRQLTVRLIADPLNGSPSAVPEILTVHLGMRKVCQHLASAS
jgi:hypothetical protein